MPPSHSLIMVLLTLVAQGLPDKPRAFLQVFSDNGAPPVHLSSKTGGVVRLTVHTLLSVRWFYDVTTEDGLVGEVCGGACRIHRNGEAVSLRDWKGRRIPGTVSVAGLEQSLPSLPPHGDLHPDVMKRVRETLQTRFHADEKDIFDHFRVDDHRRSPVALFALHAAQLARRVAPRDAQTLLGHLEKMARAFAPPGHREEDVLADVLALRSLPRAYAVDRTYWGETADQWSVLNSFPEPHRAVFDCEDGAHEALELFYVLQQHGVGSLADLARCYVGYLALGQIRVHGVYTAHAYVILLPKEPVGKDPAISIETTTYSSGAWHANLDAKRDEPAFEEARIALRAVKRSEETARIRSPLSMVAEQRIYGRLFALVTPDTYLACLAEDGKTCGPDTTSFLRFGATRRTHSIPMGDLSDGLRRMPCSLLPSPGALVYPSVPQPVLTLSPVGRYVHAWEIVKGASLYGSR